MVADEVVAQQLQQHERDVNPDNVLLEPCEQCGQLMPEDCIGWCASCDRQEKGAHDAFWEWGGWRRAFSEGP